MRTYLLCGRCVIAEMFTRKPILQGGTEFEQLIKIFDLLGSANEQNWPVWLVLLVLWPAIQNTPTLL